RRPRSGGDGMRLRVLVIAALVGVLAASTGVTAQPLTPHFPGWGRYFTVSWERFERRGQPYLRWFIVSTSGVTAARVKLLADSLGVEDRQPKHEDGVLHPKAGVLRRDGNMGVRIGLIDLLTDRPPAPPTCYRYCPVVTTFSVCRGFSLDSPVMGLT